MEDIQDLKKLSTMEIVDLARYAKNGEEYHDLIAILHLRGTIVEFEAAQNLARSLDPLEREIGADILGQLGGWERAFQDESVARLIALLADPVDEVIAAAAYSLGHRNAPEAVEDLLKLMDHPKPEIRHAVTIGLNCQEDPAAIAGLIRLAADNDKDVRNWATFGLGSQIETDSPEIRQALLARLDDDDHEIRGEALVGLARRQHPHMVDFICRELEGASLNILVVEAAEITADPQLYPLLLKWKKNDGEEDDFFQHRLEEALKACNPD